jgi:hypothetical protein
LVEKFKDQAKLPNVDKAIDLCWKLDQLQDVNDLVRATQP